MTIRVPFEFLFQFQLDSVCVWHSFRLNFSSRVSSYFSLNLSCYHPNGFDISEAQSIVQQVVLPPRLLEFPNGCNMSVFDSRHETPETPGSSNLKINSSTAQSRVSESNAVSSYFRFLPILFGCSDYLAFYGSVNERLGNVAQLVFPRCDQPSARPFLLNANILL